MKIVYAYENATANYVKTSEVNENYVIITDGESEVCINTKDIPVLINALKQLYNHES